MAMWEAGIRINSEIGDQKVQVQANTAPGAKDAIAAIYGTRDIWNLREISGNRNSNSGDLDTDTLKLTAGLVLVGGAAFVTWVCLPEILAIGGVIGAVKVANKNHEKFTKGLTGTKKNVRRFGVTFLAAMTLMSVGYGVGNGIHNAFEYERGDNTEQVQTIQQN